MMTKKNDDSMLAVRGGVYKTKVAPDTGDRKDKTDENNVDSDKGYDDASITPVRGGVFKAKASELGKKPSRFRDLRSEVCLTQPSSIASSRDEEDPENLEPIPDLRRIPPRSERANTRSLTSNKSSRTLAEIRKAKQEEVMAKAGISSLQSSCHRRNRSILITATVLLIITAAICITIPLVVKNSSTAADEQSGDKSPYGQSEVGSNIHTTGGAPFFTPVDQDESIPGEGSGGASSSFTLPPQESLEPPVDIWNLPFPGSSASNSDGGLPLMSNLARTFVNNNNDDNDLFVEPHLHQAAQQFVRRTLHANVRRPVLRVESKTEYDDIKGEDPMVVPFVDTPLSEFDSARPYPTKPAQADVPQGNVAQWEFLLKSAGVHASDIIQWDAEHNLLYVAREQHIDVVDTLLGVLRTTIRLPTPDGMVSGQFRDSWLLPIESDATNEWRPAAPKPYIEQLLLTSDSSQLVVMVSNYTSVHSSKVKPLLLDSEATHVWTFQMNHFQDESSAANKTTHEILAGSPHVIHGLVKYAAQATVNQHIHIVTSSRIDANRLLRDPVERLYYPDGRHDSKFAAEAIEAAQTKYIPSFAGRLLKEIRSMSKSEAGLTLWPLGLWIDDTELHGGAEDLSLIERQMQQLVAGQEHFQELVVVTSLTMVRNNPVVAASRASIPSATTAVSTAFLGPSATEVIGSTDTTLAMSIPGYQWKRNADSAGNANKTVQEATYIVQLELGTLATPGSSYRAATRFQSIGVVPGRLAQSARQSGEIRGHDLRLATVVAKEWSLVETEGQSIVEEANVRKSFMNVLSTENLQPRRGSPLSLFESTPTIVSAISFTSRAAYIFPVQPILPTDDAKRIQVVRFGSTTGLTYTALNEAGWVAPDAHVGFSPHLHEIGGRNDTRMLLAVGENKTTFGSLSAPMLSLWNATDPLQLKPLAQLSVGKPNILTTWKPATFRVTPRGQLILPITTEDIGYTGAEPSKANLNGFVVIDVRLNSMNERTRVVHSPAGQDDCITGDSNRCPIFARSVLASEDTLLTLQGNAARATPLGQQGTQEWSLLLT